MKDILDELVITARNIMFFMETRDDAFLNDIFAPDVVMMDSFAPYVFGGMNAVKNWADGFKIHAHNLTHLRHSFGEPQEFSIKDDRAFISIPVTWEGKTNGLSFHETGGMALVFTKSKSRWRISNYAWSAISYTSN